MHLFMARELVDKHLKVAGDFLEPKLSVGTKLKALPGMIAFYGLWYPRLWLGFLSVFQYGKYGKLAGHIRFANRASRKLARNVFHGMAWYRIKLEKKQAFLFRTVDIAMELALMCAVVSRVEWMKTNNHPNATSAAKLADMFCNNARRDVNVHFKKLWSNDDDQKYKLGVSSLDADFAWLEMEASGFGAPEQVLSEPEITAAK
jgi:hypothetical protein